MERIQLVPAVPGVTLRELLLEAGLFAPAPCGGQHLCGKCKMEVSGALSEPEDGERRFLTEAELRQGLRLGCFAKVWGPVQVAVGDREDGQILADALEEAEADLLMEGYGAAVDIGTTTVVCALYRADGTLLGTERQVNAQRSYGADVISRILACASFGTAALQRSITGQLTEMLSALCRRCAVPRSALRRAVVTGNTTMLHLFAALDPAGLGRAPYTPQTLFDETRTDLLEGIEVYLPPCVSAYVGADLTCCLLFSRLTEREETALLMDVGTNGEMALWDGGRAVCCAAAAGPAFEGSGISCGSIAGPGAIGSVAAKGGMITYTTVENAPAVSICGSGVIEALSVLRTAGVIDAAGVLREDHPVFRRWVRRGAEGLCFTFLGSNVVLTQRDIRQIQLAKAAIAGGVETLLARCGTPAADLSEVALCGGFGTSLNAAAAETIGLLPAGTGERTALLGNGALKGAAQALLSGSRREALRALAGRCEAVDLSASADFAERYIAAMSFPEI